MNNNNFIISIPTDLKQIESKLVFGLTKRQLIGFGFGIVIGVLIFILLKNINLDIAMYGLFFVASPIIFATIYKKNNMYMEKWLKLLIEQKKLNPNKRYYKVSKRNLSIARKRGLIKNKKTKKKKIVTNNKTINTSNQKEVLNNERKTTS